jgi:hypothetical protein
VIYGGDVCRRKMFWKFLIFCIKLVFEWPILLPGNGQNAGFYTIYPRASEFSFFFCSLQYEQTMAVSVSTRYDYNLMIMKSPKPATDTIYPHIKF